MKPVSVVEKYITKVSHSLFLLKTEEKLMSIEKMSCNESQKALSKQILLKVSLIRFHFASAPQYLDYI